MEANCRSQQTVNCELFIVLEYSSRSSTAVNLVRLTETKNEHDLLIHVIVTLKKRMNCEPVTPPSE